MTDHDHDHAPGSGDGHGQHDWDGRYADAGQVWSGRPNSTLVAEVAGLAPGRALDVGCGEGADAVWLAAQGWEVTALDVSQVALDRASAAAGAAGVHVHWVAARLPDGPLPAGPFDLVSVQYPALPATPGHDVERALVDAVAPGGLLLVVHHADMETTAKDAGFEPADYVGPRDVAALLGHDWSVTLDEHRPRDISGGAGAHHTHDIVLAARRQR